MAKSLSTMFAGAVICWIICGAFDRRATADPVAESADKSSSTPRGKIALVDMAKIFKGSKLFVRERELLKAKISESEEAANRMRAAIIQTQNDHKRVEAGSDEARELEAILKRQATEFEEFKKEKGGEFLKLEAAIYERVYEIVTREIATYARAHEIDLVLRFASEQVHDEDPKKLMEQMNRQVVYENRLDITEEIIAAMAAQ